MSTVETGTKDASRALTHPGLLAVSPTVAGVPALAEVCEERDIEFLRTGREAGMFVEGVSDPSLEQLRVVA